MRDVGRKGAGERGSVMRPDSNENNLRKRETAESAEESKTNKRKHTEKGRRAGGVSVSRFGDLRRLVAAVMAGVGLKRKAMIVLRGKVERQGKADKARKGASRRRER